MTVDGRQAVVIDIGSSSVRAGLYDAAGRRRRAAWAQVPYQLAADAGGSATVDVEVLLAAVDETLDRFCERAGGHVGRAAVGAISCFLHGFSVLERRGRPAGPIL